MTSFQQKLLTQITFQNSISRLTTHLQRFFRKYVDGFSEKAMQDALQRIQNAVKDGVIDKATLGQKTTDARNKFYSTDASSESGVFSIGLVHGLTH